MANNEIILKFDKLVDKTDVHYDEYNGIVYVDADHFIGFELIKEE